MEPDNLAHYAHVDDTGLVVNVSVWDGIQPYTPPEGIAMVALPYETDDDGVRRYTGGIGWTYRDGEFVDERPVEDPFE